ncbi:MAG: TlpA family protein disulfide reductase [Planctomycetales bacterium]|nr:TlpA family protein disulfide reductase [Planctomycetales bacterium]
MKAVKLPCLIVVASSFLALSITSANAEELLTIGSKAPELAIEHWIQDGAGKFKPVTTFEKGKVYVVEFWATWCGPCVASMPHLVSIQEEFASQQVQIISVSDEDLETVNNFLDRPVRASPDGSKPKAANYRELTSAYSLTTDPDQSTYEAYMSAAVQQGIPTAFIVGKEGLIEWIGYPLDLEEPLKLILADKWNRQEFAAEFKPSQLGTLVERDIPVYLEKNDIRGALAFLEKTFEGNRGIQYYIIELNVLLVANQQELAEKKIAAAFASSQDQPEEAGLLAWNIFRLAAQGAPGMDKIIAVATKAMKEVAPKAKPEKQADLLDTLAHLQFLAGDLEAALETETRASKLAKKEETYVFEFLDELTRAKQRQEQALDGKSPNAGQ